MLYKFYLFMEKSVDHFITLESCFCLFYIRRYPAANKTLTPLHWRRMDEAALALTWIGVEDDDDDPLAWDAGEDPAGAGCIVVLGELVTPPPLLAGGVGFTTIVEIEGVTDGAMDGAEGGELGTSDEPGRDIVLVLTTTVEVSVVVPEMVEVGAATEET